jgi:hypothetical protein
MFSITYGPSGWRFHSISFQNFDVLRSPLPMKTPFGTLAPGTSPTHESGKRTN